MNKWNGTLYRVNKTTAEKLYNMGFSVLFIPCNLNPENNFYCMGIWQNKFNQGCYDNFEKLYNAYSYYNCNNETGKYIAFYVKRVPVIIHFEFMNGSNPYIFRGSVLECMQELKKWGKNWNIEPIEPGFYKLNEV